MISRLFPGAALCGVRKYCVAAAGGLRVPLSSSATTLQLKSVNARTGAQFVIDGERRDARLGLFTDEGFAARKVRDDGAQFKFNGLPYAMRVGEIAVVDSPDAGASLPIRSRRIRRTNYLDTGALSGGNVLGEVDRAADITVIPVADADRLNLPYKDKKVQTHRTPEADDHRDQGRQGDQDRGRTEGQGRQARHLPDLGVALNSIRIGTVDVYGVTAIVSEKPGLTNTVVGRDSSSASLRRGPTARLRWSVADAFRNDLFLRAFTDELLPRRRSG